MMSMKIMTSIFKFRKTTGVRWKRCTPASCIPMLINSLPALATPDGFKITVLRYQKSITMKSIKDIFKKHLNAFLAQNVVSKSEFKKAFERAEKEVVRELETNWQKIKNQDVNKSLVPHRCPICYGNGLVSGSFYTSIHGCGGISSNVTETCRQCDGKGILWG